MPTLDELLDKPFSELTPEEWERVKASADNDSESQFEAWVEEAGADWDLLGEAIARVLKS